MKKVCVYIYPDISSYLDKNERRREAIWLNYADIIRYFWASDEKAVSAGTIWLSIANIATIMASIKGRKGVFHKRNTYATAKRELMAFFSENIGILAAKALAEKKYEIPHLFLLDDDNIEEIVFGDFSNRRPDYFGLNRQEDSFLFEAKGTGSTSFSNDVILKGKEQLQNIESIRFVDNDYTHFERSMTAARFSNDNILEFDLIDPPAMPRMMERSPKGSRIIMKEKEYLLYRYYGLVVRVLSEKKLNGQVEILNIHGDEYCWAEAKENIMIGMNKELFECMSSFEMNIMDNNKRNVGDYIDDILLRQKSFSLEDGKKMISVGLDGIVCAYYDRNLEG